RQARFDLEIDSAISTRPITGQTRLARPGMTCCSRPSWKPDKKRTGINGFGSASNEKCRKKN
nr:hypothetical protein [Candidatus Sigynarchaeota archaeon]